MPEENASPEIEPAAPPEPKPDRAPVIYCAASLGALCLGLGDLVNNSEAATVLKLGEVIRQTVG